MTITTDETGPYAVPQILFGVPLRLQRITVDIDRPGFMFNPTNCGRAADHGGRSPGSQNAKANVSQPVRGRRLQEPRIQTEVRGLDERARRAKPTVRASTRSCPIPRGRSAARRTSRSVKVDLPKQLPSRLTTLQKACTAATFEANPADCPAASIVGIVRASTPLLPVGSDGPGVLRLPRRRSVPVADRRAAGRRRPGRPDRQHVHQQSGDHQQHVQDRPRRPRQHVRALPPRGQVLRAGRQRQPLHASTTTTTKRKVTKVPRAAPSTRRSRPAPQAREPRDAERIRRPERRRAQAEHQDRSHRMHHRDEGQGKAKTARNSTKASKHPAGHRGHRASRLPICARRLPRCRRDRAAARRSMFASHFGWEVDRPPAATSAPSHPAKNARPGTGELTSRRLRIPRKRRVDNDPSSPDYGDVYVADRVTIVCRSSPRPVNSCRCSVRKSTKRRSGDICTEAEIKASGVKCKAGVKGTAPGQFEYRQSVSLDPDSGDVYVAELTVEESPAGGCRSSRLDGSSCLEIGKEVNEKTKGQPLYQKSKTARAPNARRPPRWSPALPNTALSTSRQVGNILAVGGEHDLLYVGDENACAGVRRRRWGMGGRSPIDGHGRGDRRRRRNWRFVCRLSGSGHHP